VRPAGVSAPPLWLVQSQLAMTLLSLDFYPASTIAERSAARGGSPMKPVIRLIAFVSVLCGSSAGYPRRVKTVLPLNLCHRLDKYVRNNLSYPVRI